ncbi:hypothetical protein [Phenylobacterium deserti]|uniref:Uncharacterized protein n=1 Tax=Phenylobacterium deserti TaxID=1914756 RepID=A0A328AS11_9CAUL|nr:hypothetical protein [Phenylobacterium deserti]RAK57740.1 hypothetical protein DJ018_07410 [Phenylobacterium deserti]
MTSQTAAARSMIVICAARAGEDRRSHPHLTVGAAYRAEAAGEGWLRVWDDREEDSLYPAALFTYAFEA